jgi:spore coat protein H
LKVHFLKDQPLAGMTGINLIFESSPRYVLAEPLAYELFRRLNVPSPASEHVRLWADGRPLGYYLLIEQPNRAFLRRQGRDPDGNLYKLLWYERGVVRQHEKKTNTRAGHADLLQLLKELNAPEGAPLWEVIQQRFNVDEMIDYFAGSMCIQNWDGFWNNYYAYHSPKAGGKWELIPWDEDKTWGDFDGCSPQYDWYSMPLTFGMRGGKTEGGSFFGGGPFGGTSWWRPPGYFSGPLLADPEFRRRFLDRLREVCETVFTPATMDPIIDAMAQRLEPEIVVSAQLRRANPEAALAEFRNHIRSFHDQVLHRRQFILDQLGAAPAGAKRLPTR